MDASQIITVFGIALPVCATVAAWFWKTLHERKAVKVALVAEIMALRQIATIRGYVEDLEATADELRKLPEESRPRLEYRVKVPEHYCRIYVENLPRLGALSLKDAHLVVKFYQYADSVIMDISAGECCMKAPTILISSPRTLRFSEKQLLSPRSLSGAIQCEDTRNQLNPYVQWLRTTHKRKTPEAKGFRGFVYMAER